MFYSHEILTNRKHGVATIWLVATLGSKSSLKKITRKAIMDVDVPNACDTITDPAAPMALRLQGNLLYGLSRVFSQQCAYILNDMQSLRDKMQGIAVLLKELEVDPNVMASRPEQLNLQADPGFNIDLDLGFDFSSFDLGSSSSGEPSSILSPQTLPSSQSSQPAFEQFLEPADPLDVSSSQNAGDGFDFIFGNVGLAAQDFEMRDASNLIVPPIDEDPVDDAMDDLLDMAEDGTLIVRDASERGNRMSDPVFEHGDDILGGGQEQGFDFDFMADGDDIGQMNLDPPQHQSRSPSYDQGAANAAALILSRQSSPHPPNAQPPEDDNVDVHESIERAGEEQSEDHIEVVAERAPQRTTRPKTVPFDDPAELPNRTLADWNDNYLDFMSAAHLEKAGRISVVQAKRNAAYWVLDQGLGDVDSNFRGDLVEHPLAVFSGQDLLDALIGPSRNDASRKRSRSQVTEDDGVREGSLGSKRVRSDLAGRASGSAHDEQDGARTLPDDDQGITFGEDEVDIEVGREQQEPLPDHPSDMPWNTYASSRQGSVRRGMSVAGVSSSAGGRRTFDIQLPSSNVKRISQMVRESPLDHRSRMARSSTMPGGPTNQNDDETYSFGADFDIDNDEVDAQLAGNLDDDFELYGPGAEVSTQEAGSGRWIAETLEKEALNFLEFLRTTIQKLEVEDDEDTEHGENNKVMTFETLLPPESNSEIVAAQGLLHVLSLATKGLINVRQGEAFGDIELSLVGGVAYGSESVDEEGEGQGISVA